MKHANGEGTVYYEKSRDAYRAAIYDDKGKRISKRFKTSQAAQEWLIATRLELMRGEYKQDSSQQLGEWINEYIDTYKRPNIRISTLTRYYDCCKYILPIAGIRLQDLTAPQIQRFFNTLPPGLSVSSRNKIQMLVRAALRKAIALGMIKDILAPVECTKGGKKKKQVEVFTIEDIHKILDWVKTSTYYKRYYLFIKLAAVTGMRLGELIALRTANISYAAVRVDLNAHAVNGRCYFNEPKTEAGIRTVTISPALAEELRRTGGDRRYVFHSPLVEFWNPNNFERAWRAIVTAAGVKYKSFHCLRHTHATQLLAAGVPLLEVSKRLGHSKASVTLDLYGHTIPGYADTLPEKIEKLYLL